MGDVLVVSGTGTEIGKTVVCSALAALAVARGARVTAVKPAQTGLTPDEPGDLAAVAAVATTVAASTGRGGSVRTVELVRYPDPLAPAAAARLCGAPPLDLRAAAAAVRSAAADSDLLLVEGAGGLLVHFDDAGATLADLARELAAPVLVVTPAGLGALNGVALTAEALDRRGLALAGVVIGAWPAQPDLASWSNVADFARITGQPLAGALPAGLGAATAAQLLTAARAGLAPAFGGTFDAQAFDAAAGQALAGRR